MVLVEYNIGGAVYLAPRGLDTAGVLAYNGRVLTRGGTII